MRGRVGGVIAGVALLVAVVAPPASSAGVRYLDEVFSSVEVTTDIVYGQATNKAGQLQDLHLDLYEPEGDTATDRAVFVWAHGGFFTRGNKSQIGVIADHMARRGWVTISVQYRLDPTLPEGIEGYLQAGDLNELLRLQEAVRDAQHDIQAAVRWVRANAGTYGFDPGRIAAGGHSAGATAAMNVAYNSDDPGSSGKPGYPSDVQAALGTGTTNIPPFDTRIDPGVEPPVAMYHGMQDELAPWPWPMAVCLLATALLNTCEFHLSENEDHNSRIGLADWPRFLHEHVIKGAEALVRLPEGFLPPTPAIRIPPGTIPVPPIPLPV